MTCHVGASPRIKPHLDNARKLSHRYRCPGYDRQDLEQEAALAVVSSLFFFDPGQHGDSIDAYLAVVVRRRLSRLVADSVRRYEREAMLDDGLVDPDPGPAESMLSAEVLERAWDVLPVRQAGVLQLSMAGHTDEEIAERMVVTLAATRALRMRAVARLRQIFGG